MKYKVKITRTEVYERYVEIEAENPQEAETKAKENELNNQYADKFDSPDSVQTLFSISQPKNLCLA